MELLAPIVIIFIWLKKVAKIVLYLILLLIGIISFFIKDNHDE